MYLFCRVNLFFILCRTVIAELGSRCPLATSLKNGKITLQSRGGITAVFTCDTGYSLHGSNVSHCQTDGHWSSSLPSCNAHGQKCSSGIERFNLIPGQVIKISCSIHEIAKENQHFWIGNGKFVEPSIHQNKSIEISIKSDGLYICLNYSPNEVKILRTIQVSLKTPTMVDSNKCKMHFTNQTTYINATITSKVSLSCEAESRHVSVSWLKNGKEVYDRNSTYTNSVLNITFMQAKHEGNYTCFVKYLEIPNCFTRKSFILKMRENISNSYGCGQPITNTIVRRWKRVIDGNRAVSLSAPWMGMLSMNREPPFCGCSLISEKWIVTAAHCFRSDQKTTSQFMSQEDIKRKIAVKFGKYIRRQSEKGELVRSISNLIIHPHFKLSLNNAHFINEHDIALGRLNESITFQKHVLPICLPPPGFMSTIPSGTLGTVTGWGKVSVLDSVMALTLQEAYLPIVNSNFCQNSSSYIITDNMLCAGYAESFRPDTCSGDSGGPFILKKYNVWFLIGVVSWGEGCSNPKKFGVYTKVENYVPWIQSIITEKNS